MDYLSRYIQGEYEEVWTELLALGPAIRHDRCFPEALAVARETMRRVRNNISVLYERLNYLNYKFVYPEKAFLPPDDQIKNRISMLEAQGLLLPLSLSTFCEMVGSVCFTGSHPNLGAFLEADAAFFDYPIYSDPLTVFAPQYDEAEKYALETDLDSRNIDDNGQLIFPYAIEVIADEVSKTGQSGGALVDILLPNGSMDAPVRFWSEEVNFIEYLRISIIGWGGFPGFASLSKFDSRKEALKSFFKRINKESAYDTYFEEKLDSLKELPKELRFLTDGLEPF